jgi:hypothetical protein
MTFIIFGVAAIAVASIITDPSAFRNFVERKTHHK